MSAAKPLQRCAPEQRKIAAFMLACTASYLIVELGFNARLLDVVGGMASHDEVDHIEKFGRVISGTALTLFVWGSVLKAGIKRAWLRREIALALAISAGVCIAAMYFGQRLLIDTLVDGSSTEGRSRAAVLVPMSHLLTEEGIDFKGLDLTPEDYRTPEGKTFIATFALQALAVPDLGARLAGQAEAMFARLAESTRGRLDGFHRAYARSQTELEKVYYGAYADGIRKYNGALASIPSRQAAAYDDYVRGLRQKRLHPNSVPRAYWGRVRGEVQNKGVPVPNDWVPSDRARFEAAVARKVQTEALQQFRDGTRASLDGHEVDPGLSLPQFFTHPAIQAKWHKVLQVPGQVPLRPGLGVREFEAYVFNPTVADDARRQMTQRMAAAAEYDDHRRLSQIGKDSYRGLIVPPIALAFSLLGAFTHILKCALWIAKLFVVLPGRLIAGVTAAYLSCVLAIPLALTNRVSQQPLFERLAGHTRQHMGSLQGTPINMLTRWAVQMQHYFYPVNEFTRVRLLGGATYGYTGRGSLAVR